MKQAYLKAGYKYELGRRETRDRDKFKGLNLYRTFTKPNRGKSSTIIVQTFGFARSALHAGLPIRNTLGIEIFKTGV